MKSCKQCNVEFEEKDYRQKFCSQSCSATQNNKIRLQKQYRASDRVCKICTKQLLNHQKSVCSVECNYQWHWVCAQIKIERGEKVANDTLRKYLSRVREHQCEICKGIEWFGNQCR